MERSDTSEEGDRYFAAVAESYDRLQPVLSPPYEKGLKMIVDLIPFDPEETFEFVDLGCGTAEPAFRVLQHFPQANGTCIDSEPEMLPIASKKLAAFPSRAEVLQGDMTHCEIPGCDVVLSAKAVHHVPPDHLTALFARIRGALRPGGCFILYDAMSLGPSWGPASRQQVARFRRRHVQRAIDSGIATREEIERRRDYKRRMKAAGKDVEYEHDAEGLMRKMGQAGFDEVSVAWRMFAERSWWPSAKETRADVARRMIRQAPRRPTRSPGKRLPPRPRRPAPLAGWTEATPLWPPWCSCLAGPR